MALEFLQTDGDIVEFMSFLYERNFRISYRLPRKAHIELDQSAAVQVLQHDLYTIWSCYYIGDENRREILMLDSCGPRHTLATWAGQAGLRDESAILIRMTPQKKS